MSLLDKSTELKKLVSAFDTRWFLGDLSFLMTNIASGRAQDQLGKLSSPLRQLYYLAGLVMASDDSLGAETSYTQEKWEEMVRLLNEIEVEHIMMFLPTEEDDIDEEWLKKREVTMPSFLSYFNQGPLNYEEQSISWISELFSWNDHVIETELGVTTENFLSFYDNLEKLVQSNFNSFGSKGVPLRPNWKSYSKLSVGLRDNIPEPMKEEFQKMFEEREAMMLFMADKGMIYRFHADELVSADLDFNKVNIILGLLSCERANSEFIYYASTRPINQLYPTPIVKIEQDLFQVFEIKQVLHAIESCLEAVCVSNAPAKDIYVKKKGEILEEKIIALFKKLMPGCQIFSGYYVDGCEQDILVLWKNNALVIEAKGYNLREPLRDSERAFTRIKDDFVDCIGYAFDQTSRVTDKFIKCEPLVLCDKNGKAIETIDTTLFDQSEYSIIVNLTSFGQVQTDLSMLLEVEEDQDYPLAIKFDDLEVFILTLIARKENPQKFIDYLGIREMMHGKLICSDELEACGGFLNNILTQHLVESKDIIQTSPDMANIFDAQYSKGMGFDDERMLAEKKSGNYMIW